MASDMMRLAGLNTGFDTEAMIEQMMSAYQSKIDTQTKKLQTLQWKQEQYRDIITKLSDFKNKYFDILKRDTYLMTPSNFNRLKSTVTSKSGKESGLKVTLSSDAAVGNHTIKVNQQASAAVTKGGQVAAGNFKLDVEKALEDATADEDGNYNFSLDVKVGNVAKTVEFSGKDKDELLASLNSELADAFGTTSSGDAFISAEMKDGEFAFKTTGNAMATVTERVGNFGMGKPSAKVAIDPAAALTGKSSISVTVPNHYDGKPVTKNVEFETVSNTYFDSRGDNEEVNALYLQLKKQAYASKTGMNASEVTEEMMNEAKFTYSSADAAYDYNKDTLLSALNGAYGLEQGVSFSLNGSSITATYMQDGSAVEFTMTSTCDATFGLKKGSATSYMDENTKLADMGIEMNHTNEDGEADGYTININGKDITVGAKATVADLMNAVNKSDAGVTLSYSKLEGCFTLTANDKGNGGDVEVDGANALAQALKLTDDTRASHEEGKNALITIDGVTVEHNDNVYEMDGVTYDFSAVDPTEGDTMTVNIEKDNSAIKETVKSFVEDYNKMIDEISNYTYTARPKDSKENYYEPLTDEEKEGLSDKEIEKLEEAAKKGLLYHDSTVMSVMSRIRSALTSSVTLEDGTKIGLYSVGVKTASFLTGSQQDAMLGKLTFDEDAFDKALEEHPDALVKLFTDPNEGVMAKTKNAIDDAVRETSSSQGTLIRKAGTEKGLSSKTNAIYKEMERINKRIEKLQETYNKKEDYWWKVFTNLEKMQAQFNSQQSYISQFNANGGYLS